MRRLEKHDEICGRLAWRDSTGHLAIREMKSLVQQNPDAHPSAIRQVFLDRLRTDADLVKAVVDCIFEQAEA
jgi:hypothetical protein